jgi:alkylhydroperoxidase/carboxymuconolactone decarboxylase family protein YurZ
MADDAAALDDLLATPAPMGDDESDPNEAEPDDDTDDEFSMHAETALDPDADPEERKDALRMAILSLTRGST